MGRRIFIHHEGALGDLLLSLPAIERMKGVGDSVHLAGRRDAMELLKRIGYVSDATDSDSQFFLPLFSEEPDPGIKDFLLGFDEVAVFTSDPSSGICAGAVKISPAIRKIRTIPPRGLRMHVADFRCGQIRSRQSADTPISRLCIPTVFQDGARAILIGGGYDFRSPLVAVHPGSGSKMKRWPVRKFAELIVRLGESSKAFFMVFSGPAEESNIREEIAACLEGRDIKLVFFGDCDLATVASLLSLSCLYIGNDSGITHLAAAVSGGRIVAVFGPTDPILWAPRAGHVSVFFSDMECVPCETKEPSGDFRKSARECGAKCLSDITVQSVLEQCDFSVA